LSSWQYSSGHFRSRNAAERQRKTAGCAEQEQDKKEEKKDEKKKKKKTRKKAYSEVQPKVEFTTDEGTGSHWTFADGKSIASSWWATSSRSHRRRTGKAHLRRNGIRQPDQSFRRMGSGSPSSRPRRQREHLIMHPDELT